MKQITYGLVLCCTLIFTGCASQPNTLYEQIGGNEKVSDIVDYFIEEIEFNSTIFNYFKDSDVERFRNKMTEHLCVAMAGDCIYTGDEMLQIHQGMNITEADFNLTVELLINAMTKANVSHRHQNLILNQLIGFRKDIIYQ